MKRFLFFVIIFAAGMLVFFAGGYWAGMSYHIRTVFKVSLPVVLLFLTLACRRYDSLGYWYRLALGFFAASCGFLAGWFLSNPLMRLFGLSAESVSGIAFAKLFDAIPIVAASFAVAWAGGLKPSDLFIKKGKVKGWAIVGSVSFAVFLSLFIIQARGEGIGAGRLLRYAPWTLIFVFSNAFMEEFHFRGLLLGPAGEILGRHTGNICVALFFAIVHAPVKYTPDIFVFVPIVFILALAWGYIMQKTESIWGAVLFHAGADLMIVMGIYNTYGAC